MYAIKNKRTGKWVYGSDFRYHPPHQRTSFERALLFDDIQFAKTEFKRRECSKDYLIVKVELKEILEK